MKKNTDIVIVGLGLMGASLGRALTKRYPQREIVGLTRSRGKIARAKKEGIITRGTTSVEKAFAHAAIIVVATPVSTICDFIKKADRYAPSGAVVTDVGSTKEEMVQWAEKQSFKNISFVGSHPLCGSHKSGMEAVVPNLYRGALCFVTPTEKTSSDALATIGRMWKAVRSQVVLISPSAHDEVLASISHMPHVAAFALVGSVAEKCPEALGFVGSGFRDMSRLAASDAKIWSDIVLANKNNIVKSNAALIAELKNLNGLIRRGDRKALSRYFERVKSIRETLQQ